MKEDLLAKLTAKDDRYACAFADRILLESQETSKWYACLDDFAALLNHPKSLVRNRALHILAANVQWDADSRFDAILPDVLAHVTDEKPITARQCVKALARIGLARPRYIPSILSRLRQANLSCYRDSMRPLIEKDIAETEGILTDAGPVSSSLSISASHRTGESCGQAALSGGEPALPLDPGKYR